MSNLIQQKVSQAIQLLEEFNIDLWLTFVRETSAAGDPVLPLIYGHDLTWQSALLIHRSGHTVAIVGHFEAQTAEDVGAYREVIPYHESIRSPLLETFERLKPASIGINFSPNDVLADGLGLGLYQVLLDFLDGTPWKDRLTSAEKVIAALRGRKTSLEVEYMRQAIRTTEAIFLETFETVKPGWSERQVADFMQKRLKSLDLSPAWEINHCPTVNSGPDSPVGHVSATEHKIQPGHILHIDFGVKENHYCADIQRVAYFLREGEAKAPYAVQNGFDTIVKAIQKTVSSIRPGMLGYEVDEIARRIVTGAGFDEYKYATGHHLGQLAHDGAGVLGPRWERYGKTPEYPVEPGHVYTIEPGLMVPGYGYVGIEEDVLITENGAEFLSNPQLDIILL